MTRLDSGLDQAYEDKSLKEIIAAAVLAGGPHGTAQSDVPEVFGIQTVAELRSDKYFAVAGALVALGNKI